MQTIIIEATNGPQNWGKFMVGRFDWEWDHKSEIDAAERRGRRILGSRWSTNSLLVLDLETGEGAIFKPGGIASADLHKHRVWVCPLFEPFLEWLYKQDLTDLDKLPKLVDLPDAEFQLFGYRRPGQAIEKQKYFENKNLYDVAKRTLFEAGLPWTDPRTMKTYHPPKKGGKR